MAHFQPDYQNQQPDQIEATNISPEEDNATLYTSTELHRMKYKLTHDHKIETLETINR